MASRIHHKKSRGGCNQCKTRRIKCDENGPPCYGCITRSVTCEYSNRARLAQRFKALGKQRTAEALMPLLSATSSGNDSPVVELPISNRRKAELALMNHWTASTCLTFCHQTLQKAQEDERKFWQQHMPTQALEFSYLLHAMFSITNLHLASDSHGPSFREKYITAGIEYHSSALKLFIQALPNVTKDNCQSIFICSLAFFVLSIALPQMVLTQQVDRTSVKDSIFQCLDLYRGSRRILSMFEQELQDLSSAVVLAPKDMSLYPQEDPDFSNAIARLRECVELESLTPQHTGTMPPFERMINTINELEACSKRLANGIHAALVGWLITLEDDFLCALRDDDVLATIIVMHWAVLLDKPDRLWWSFRSGQSLIKELLPVLPLLNTLESESFRWCCSQVSLDAPGLVAVL